MNRNIGIILLCATIAECGFSEPSTNYPTLKFPPVDGNHVLVANSSAIVTPSMLQHFHERMMPLVRIPTLYTNTVAGKSVFGDVEELMKDEKVRALILIVDSDTLPAILTAPESAWVVFNPRRHCTDLAEIEKNASRIDKELWRCFGYVLGCSNANFPSCVMKSVKTTEDLDSIKGKRLAPESFNKVFRHARFLGIERMTPILLDKDGNTIQIPGQAAATNAPAATSPAK